MKKSALLAAALIAVMAFSACGGDTTPSNSPTATPPVTSGDATATPPAPTDVVDPGDVGEIDVVELGALSERNAEGLRVDATTNGQLMTIAMDDWKKTLFQPAIDEFNATYPNIELELRQVPISDNNVMTALMAARALPDVVYDFMRPLPDWTSLGWIYPLDELVEGDPDWAYVPDAVKEWFIYGGKLYALPTRAHLNNSIMVNLDLMDQLNLDLPAADWTFDDYKAFLVAGTTDEFSGSENLPAGGHIGAAHHAGLGNYGYDRTSNTYDVAAGWLDGLNITNELKAIPGVIAGTLRDQDDYWGNADCDYTKKFGEGNIGDGNMAFKMGKVLTTVISTGSVGEIHGIVPFNWQFLAFPQVPGVGTRPATQTTYSVVAATTKFPEAAFEAAKWFSFGEKGMIMQLECYNLKDDMDGAQFIVPVSKNPAILAKFESLNLVSEGVLQMVSNMDNAIQDAMYQMIPSYGSIVDEFLTPLDQLVVDGGDPVALAAEASQKASEAGATYWAEYEEKLAAAQAAFDAKR